MAWVENVYKKKNKVVSSPEHATLSRFGQRRNARLFFSALTRSGLPVAFAVPPLFQVSKTSEKTILQRVARGPGSLFFLWAPRQHTSLALETPQSHSTAPVESSRPLARKWVQRRFTLHASQVVGMGMEAKVGRRTKGTGIGPKKVSMVEGCP